MSRSRSRPGIAVEIQIEAGDWSSQRRVRPLVERAVAAAAAAAKPKISGEAELSVLLTDDAHIKRLNRKFRGKDDATNVLSFPAPGPGNGGLGTVLGDIALAHETIEKEAESAGLTFQAHLTHLIVHGFLHLLGYDHLNDADAANMEGLETAVLAGLGIADPYADD